MIAILIVCLLLVLLLLISARFLKGVVDPVKFDPAAVPSENALALHRELLIADMHADSLLYNNSLLVRSRQGHVDLPRLIEGNVAIQVFTCVSKFPVGANINRSGSNGDFITLAALLQGWPVKTWSSLCERALYQAAKLHTVERNSNGRLSIIKNQSELGNFMELRSRQPGSVGAILGLEGGHCLEGKLENLDLLFQAGYRLMSPTHFFDNELGGSMHGAAKQGLTPFGYAVIRRMQELDMIIDLAHASTQMMDDVLGIVTRPVVVSHTGVKGVCNNNRNLSDEYLRKIARNGGIVGIGFWDKATGSGDVRGIARSIRYAVDLVGVEHVGIGSDFDGCVKTPFDVSQIAQLTGALLQQGFSPDEVKRIMGGNFYALLQRCLPKD